MGKKYFIATAIFIEYWIEYFYKKNLTHSNYASNVLVKGKRVHFIVARA